MDPIYITLPLWNRCTYHQQQNNVTFKLIDNEICMLIFRKDGCCGFKCTDAEIRLSSTTINTPPQMFISKFSDLCACGSNVLRLKTFRFSLNKDQIDLYKSLTPTQTSRSYEDEIMCEVMKIMVKIEHMQDKLYITQLEKRIELLDNIIMNPTELFK
jgi:hypothetical protein